MPAAVDINSPISRTIDPNLQVTSHDDQLELDKAFDKAFGPLHDLGPREIPAKEEIPSELKESTALEQPGPAEEKEPPPGEAKEPPAPSEPKQEVVEPKAIEPVKDPDDEPDEEADQLRLHPDSRPETVETFRKLRGMFKTQKKSAKELQDKLHTQEREITQLKTGPRQVSDPEVQKELEDLRTFRTEHRMFDNLGYQHQYEQPVRAMFDDIVNDIKSLAPDPKAAEDWEKQIRSAGPDRLDRGYWNEGVLQQCSDPLHKDRLTRKISFLLEAQDRRDHFRKEMVEHPDAFVQFTEQQQKAWWDKFHKEAGEEAERLVPSFGEWASPKDPSQAKTAHERAAIDAHNKTYQVFADLFLKHLNDVAHNGPKAMTRVALEATRSEKYRQDLEAATTKLTKLQTELKAAQDELTKIAGARSRVVQSGTPVVNSGKEPVKRRLSQTVGEAFREHFGT